MLADIVGEFFSYVILRYLQGQFFLTLRIHSCEKIGIENGDTFVTDDWDRSRDLIFTIG